MDDMEKKHNLAHWEDTFRSEEAKLTVGEAASGVQALGHCLALGLSDLSVWCYKCESYVQHEFLVPLVERMEVLKFGEKQPSKQSPCASEATEVGSIMKSDYRSAHGRLAPSGWALPTVARVCNDEARPGYRTMLAHEYLDSEDVLKAKVRLVADLIRESKYCVAYTGAGISTAAGIKDYATKASESIAGKSKKVSPWHARPTLAHRVMVGLYEIGYLKHWIQQNHDGLPQKAGFPQHRLNEIHGAWFDPSNPVVPMTGTLRPDLIEKLSDCEDSVDLCLALGSSLVGMNADRIATTAARRQRLGESGARGTVIVALQQTQHDAETSVRIFATIDRFAELLAAALDMTVPQQPSVEPCVDPVWQDLPYTKDGVKMLHSPAKGEGLTLDLRPGSQLRVIGQPDWDVKKVGDTCCVVEPKEFEKNEGHICVRFGPKEAPICHRIVGGWFLAEASKGLLDKLPFVPV